MAHISPPTASLATHGEELEWDEALPYFTLSRNACTPIGSVRPSDTQTLLLSVVDQLNSRSMADVQARAGAGSPDDMLDLALRYTAGVTTRQDFPAALLVLKALTSQLSTPRSIRARAYSILAHVHNEIRMNDHTKGRVCNIDTVFRAADAANAAAGLGFVSPIIIVVAMFVEHSGLRRQSECTFTGLSVERFEQLTDLWRVSDRRAAEVQMRREAREDKVSKAPNAYVCATAGCGIEATHKSTLQQCAGKCRKEGKPSYCSKDCQRKDWKRHKPFCRVNAPIDEVAARQRPHDPTETSAFVVGTGGEGKTVASTGQIWEPSEKHEHSIDIPHPFIPGGTTKFVSQTMDPTFLKEIRDAITDKTQ